MLPDWYVRLSAASGQAFVPALTNADVVAVALIAFVAFLALGTLLAADWPADVAFLALVAGGILADWPAMIVLSLGAVLAAIAISVIHSVVAPARAARITAEAERRAIPALDAFMRDAGLGDADRKEARRIVEIDRRRDRPSGPAP